MCLFKVVFLFSDTYPGVELLSHMVILFLIVCVCVCFVFKFLRIIHAVLHSACTNLQSHHCVGDFPFPHILTHICYLCSF